MPLSDRHRQKRGRNFALAGVLVLLVVLFFVVSIVKMGGAP
ncbi:MAG: hypothetical protein RIM84_00550 [Alphaproteobacteria bacterium]